MKTKVIPHTEGRYSVDISDGQVYDYYENIYLTPFMRDSVMCYRNIHGLSRYYPDGVIPSATLVLHAVHDVTIPVYLWHKLSPGFSNGILLDCNINNLFWRLPDGPIESVVHTGYYYIPEVRNLLVGKDSSLLSYANGEMYTKSPSISCVEYLEVTVSTTLNKRQAMKVHTLTALGCVRRPNIDPLKLFVNHIDLNKFNNDCFNLEFVTPTLNNLHAALFDESSVGMVRYTLNGTEHRFNNLIDLSEHLGIAATHIWVGLRNGIDQFNGGTVIISSSYGLTDEGMLIDISGKNNGKGIRKTYISKDETLEVWDLQTDSKYVLSTIIDAAKIIGVNPAAIRYQLDRPGHHRLRNRFLVKRTDSVWPSKELIDSYVPGSGKMVTVCRNVATGEMTKYVSATDAWKSLNLSKKAVTTSLGLNNKRNINGYQFQYLEADKDINDLVW